MKIAHLDVVLRFRKRERLGWQRELADKAGVKGPDVAACSTQSEAQAHIEASVNLGKSLDVNSTPTLFINGRPVGVNANNYDALKQLVDFAAKEK